MQVNKYPTDMTENMILLCLEKNDILIFIRLYYLCGSVYQVETGAIS